MTKKKIKDLTLEELKKLCKSYSGCIDCPLYDVDFICRTNPCDFSDDELNQEIEVEEDES